MIIIDIFKSPEINRSSIIPISIIVVVTLLSIYVHEISRYRLYFYCCFLPALYFIYPDLFAAGFGEGL